MSRTINTGKKPESQEEKNLRKTGDGKLIITSYLDLDGVFLLKNERILAVNLLNNKPSFLGGIYIARVRDVVKNIDACFVEIQKGEVCFLPKSECKNIRLYNREYDGSLKQGDEFPVKVIKDAIKTKVPMVSATFKQKDCAEELLEAGKYKTAFTCLRKPLHPILNAIQMLATKEEYCEIVTDMPSFYELLLEDQKERLSDIPVRLYQDETFSLTKLYALNSKMDIALERRIWLKSGAFLIIEQTEAMTVIDVNSGKYEAKKQTEEYFSQVNREAAEEIALQLRLRNLSGIIIVDFINLKTAESQKSLMEYMTQLVQKDVVPTNVVDFTALGLMEITRKKTHKSLSEQIKSNKRNGEDG